MPKNRVDRLFSRWAFLGLSAIVVSCAPSPYFATIDANAKYSSGRYQEAVPGYLGVLASKEQHDLASYNIGTCYLSLGEMEAAESHLSRASESGDHDTSADAWYNLGVLALERKEWKSAYSLFKKSLKLKPALVDAKANLEIAFANMRDENAKQGSAGANVSVKKESSRDENVFSMLKNSETARWKSYSGAPETPGNTDDY